MLSDELTPGWNCYLSYVNNINNKRLLAASAALAVAQEHAASSDTIGLSTLPPAVAEELRTAAAAVEKAKTKRDKIREAEGGGATGVGTRMGWS